MVLPKKLAICVQMNQVIGCLAYQDSVDIRMPFFGIDVVQINAMLWTVRCRRWTR